MHHSPSNGCLYILVARALHAHTAANACAACTSSAPTLTAPTAGPPQMRTGAPPLPTYLLTCVNIQSSTPVPAASKPLRTEHTPSVRAHAPCTTHRPAPAPPKTCTGAPPSPAWLRVQPPAEEAHRRAVLQLHVPLLPGGGAQGVLPQRQQGDVHLQVREVKTPCPS